MSGQNESFDTPQKLIDRLRGSKELYEEAASKEGQVWGAIFSNEKMNLVRAEDQIAAQSLRLSQDRSSLFLVAKEAGLHFPRALSLACGSGRAERQLIKLGVCGSCVGIDIAEHALDEARKMAAEEGHDIDYREGDLNRLTLPRDEFDLVVTQNCLHHVLELEKLAEEIWLSLKPEGRVWIDDFIGETQFQWSDLRLSIVNRLLKSLPDRYRLSAMNGNVVGPYVRRPPGKLVSPFEAIRSSEIVPIFARYFEIEYRQEWNSVLHLICPVGTRKAYAESEEGRTLFALLQEIDRILIESRTLPALGGQYLMKKRSALLHVAG